MSERPPTWHSLGMWIPFSQATLKIVCPGQAGDRLAVDLQSVFTLIARPPYFAASSTSQWPAGQRRS